MNNNGMMPYNMMPSFPGGQAMPPMMGPMPPMGQQMPPMMPGGQPPMFPGMHPNENLHEMVHKLERDVNRLERQVRRLEEKVNNIGQIPMPLPAEKDNFNQYPNNMYMM